MPPPTAKFTPSTPLWFLPKDSAFHHRAHPSAAADDYGYFSRAEAEAACAEARCLDGLASHADLRHALYPANHSRTFFCWRGYVDDSESSFAYLDARNLPDEYTGDCAAAARSHELQGFIESPPGSKSGAYCLGCPPLERPASHKVEVLLPVAGAPSDLSTAVLRQILDAAAAAADAAAAAQAAVEAAVAAAADGGDKGRRAAQERAVMSELVSVTAEEGCARAEAEAARRREAAEAARRRAEELGGGKI